jgi:hypothetical protein
MCLQGEAIYQVVSSDRSEDSSAEDKRCRKKDRKLSRKAFGLQLLRSSVHPKKAPVSGDSN